MEQKKILVVEDEEDIVRALTIRLKSVGYRIVVANDGTMAVQLAHRENPDLVILDLMLPAGDGLSVLENIRLSLELRSVPIIILTGTKDQAYKKKILDMGVDVYFEKPYEPEKLLDSIKNLLEINGG